MRNNAMQNIRTDGFKIFLDNDPELNHIRKNADKKTVIKAVAIRRAQTIALNYAKKYALELAESFAITSLRKQRSLKNCFMNYLEAK